jgi:hypothetical protein
MEDIMKRSLLCGAAIMALSAPGASWAATPSSVVAMGPVSAFAMPVATPDLSLTLPVVGEEQLAVTVVPVGSRYEASRYRPRRHPRVYRERPSSSYARAEGATQIHAGFLDPEGETATSGFLAGFRVGMQPDPHVEIGGGLDWRHKSERATEVLTTGPGPSGSEIVTRREVSRSSSDLFPFMAYVQLNADRDLPIIPYFGLSGGYEVLFLSAEDFATGEEFDGTFGGFGWQAWVGAALPLGPRAKFTGEVFINDAELGRDVEDALTGEQFRETVDMDGAGMRFGLSWSM